MKLHVAPQAQRDADRIDEWWRENRRAARELFTKELLQALDRIQHMPGVGVVYETDEVDLPVRRVLLKKTKHHVYYMVEGDTVVVLAVWSAVRGRGPRLR